MGPETRSKSPARTSLGRAVGTSKVCTECHVKTKPLLTEENMRESEGKAVDVREQRQQQNKHDNSHVAALYYE
jgi:hypothetical protein